MFTDICIPNNNEEEFILIAEKLETKKLLFLYDKKEKDLSELQKKTKIKLFSGLIDSQKENALNFAKGERKNVENKKIKFLYGFEELEQKDSLHYKRSGINQVIGKLLKDKEKVLVIDMEKVFETKNKEKLLGRIQFNLKLAKKYKLNLVIASFAKKPKNMRSGKDYEALIRVLGYQEEAKKAVNTLNQVLLV